jgi:hypothetical protein
VGVTARTGDFAEKWFVRNTRSASFRRSLALARQQKDQGDLRITLPAVTGHAQPQLLKLLSLSRQQEKSGATAASGLQVVDLLVGRLFGLPSVVADSQSLVGAQLAAIGQVQ